MLPFASVGSLLPGADPGKEIGTAADEKSNSTLGLGTIQGGHLAAGASTP